LNSYSIDFEPQTQNQLVAGSRRRTMAYKTLKDQFFLVLVDGPGEPRRVDQQVVH
jgi:hypothetical protein